ncbi:helix-turn-helix transcriptional regulator [Pseudoneobacillus rhizosphaerae]|uniref:helix-turn-helix transcriptional regulator n=1 Tax=Pseudoneobacillus rhizosphaerae TaxID=2880968 RepID=UPI001E45801B|nr:helix-turn-helix domain-containing protein [Pseudoneobacillus rhizosphaerae]
MSYILLEQDRSQKWLADEIEVSMATISQIKKGKRLPTLPVALRIAKALNKNVEEIWVEENNESID